MAIITTPSSSTPVGAIVGGTLGGLGLVAIIVCMRIYFLRRRKRGASVPGIDDQPELRRTHDHGDEAAQWGLAELPPEPLPGELPSKHDRESGPPSHKYHQIPSELPSTETPRTETPPAELSAGT